jgi:hypothetical protein
LAEVYPDLCAATAIVANENASLSPEELLHRSKLALAEADRIDLVKNCPFYKGF